MILALAVVAAWGFLSLRRRNVDVAPPAHSLRPAPNIDMAELDGRRLNLAQWRGKVILVNFWATWCAACRDEIPFLNRLSTKYRRRGLRVVGISLDDRPQDVSSFDRKFHMNYPVVLGTAEIAEKFGGVLGLPMSFLIGRDGRVKAKFPGELEPETFTPRLRWLLR